MLIASAALVAMTTVAPIQSVETVDVAYEELASGQNQAAIQTLETSEALEANDPARLMNLAAAYAREGELAEAQAMYRAAIFSEERQLLETGDGRWVDSRVLARQALAALENSAALAATRMASAER